MEPVSVLGVGMHSWGKWGRPFHEYAVAAAKAAVADASLTLRDIDFVVAAGTVRCGYEGHVAGCTVARELGLSGVECVTVYGACTSGAMALAVARDRILAGLCRFALIVGADIALATMTIAQTTDEPNSRARDVETLDNSAYLGLRATRRMHDRDTTVADLDLVRMKNSAHGALNPNARFRIPLSQHNIELSPMVATPLRLLHISTFSDGAAAVVLCSAGTARSLGASAAMIRAISVSTLSDESLEAPYWSAQRPSARSQGRADNIARSLSASGISRTDLSLIELYDVSSVSELDWYEHIGLCEAGGAERLLRSGATSLGGHIPVNVSGGLTSFGESVAAQALAQVCEVTWQLRGTCGHRQVAGARVGLTVSDGMYGHIASIVMSH
jgi:acetyl-CoA acetyltransferase